MRYLITFSCYGAHLHGEEAGSVDDEHNRYGGPLVAHEPARWRSERAALVGGPYLLDTQGRLTVLRSLQHVCTHRKWELWAVHVRSTHVHAVVEAGAEPEKVMNDFKSYASRALNRAGEPNRKRWALHGGTQWLYSDQSVQDAIKYVAEKQGVPMAVFTAEDI